MSTAGNGEFVHIVRVGWGHCDPARIAYTARLPEFALEAIDAWWEHHFGTGWYQMELDTGTGTPFVHLELDFRSPVTPRHRLHCHVRPVRLGSRSIEFRVAGYQDGTLCFEGRFVSVFIHAGSMRTRTAPEHIRARITAMIAAGAAVPS
ncbi:MAG: acyl-CoA thioesterase [Alphaproteobacteria bacterium]|nr:MAG: acyl-CoA thioesterase [Alphaproteobacteria bacterium]